MRHSCTKTCFSSFIAIAFMFTSMQALAQSQNAPASENSEATAEPQTSGSLNNSESSEGYGDEIVVTAQKREQNLQNVAAAITAVNSRTLQERGITTTDDLKFVVPSLQVGELGGNTNVNIRGVGLNLVSTVAPPGVAIHIDGVYQPITAMGDLVQIDLERVEVLRGPQGTLYGRNANAGAINFITKAPTDRFEGYVQAGYATYDQSRLQGIVNIPVSDDIAIRAVGDWVKRRDGYYKNVVPGLDDIIKGETLSGRLRIAANVTDKLTLDINLSKLKGSGPYYGYVNFTKPNADALRRNPFLANAIVSGKPNRTSANDPSDSDRDLDFAAATLTWELDDVQLKSITGYQYLHDRILSDDDGSNISAFLGTRNSRNKSFSQEFNLSASLGPVDAITGFFYLNDRYRYLVHYDLPLGLSPLPAGSILDFFSPETKTKALAVFGDVTVNLSERFRVFGGLRYSNDKIEATQVNSLRFGPTGNIIFSCPLQTNKLKFNSTTPRAGAQFDLSDDSNVFATYSQGFKDGGFNRTQCNANYNPETIKAYETGIKNRVLDGRATLNISGFYYDYKNLQLVQQVGLGNRVTNAASATIKGLELEATWNPSDNWTFNGNVSALDAKYKNFVNVDTLFPGLGFQDVSGNRLNNAPKFSTNVGLSYRTDQSNFGRVTLRADGSYRSRYYFREFNRPEDSQAAYALLNIAIIWDSPNDQYRVRLYGNNIFNQGYVSSLAANDAFGSRNGTWGTPSQFGC